MLKKGIGVVWFIILVNSFLVYGQTEKIYGVVKDSTTGEFLIGATIKDLRNIRNGVFTNAYGFFSLNLKQIPGEVEVSMVGYLPQKISVNESKRLDVLLKPLIIDLNEVEVKAPKDQNLVINGKNSIYIETIKAIPSVGGEPDLMKALQLLPGVKTANEGTTNLSIRGGSYDQTLILLDEAPVYNPSHALSFISIFDTDAIKSVDLYKGFLPANFGGRLSGIVDIRMKDGNKQKTEANANIGVILTKLNLSKPILKNKGSIFVSGRYSYAGQVINSIVKLYQTIGLGFNKALTDNIINFYDFNAKINLELNKKNNLYYSNYRGKDIFQFYLFNNGTNLKWGNTTHTLRWNRIHSQSLFSNTSLIYSDYFYNYRLINDKRNFDWAAGHKEVTLKQDFDWYPRPNVSIKTGYFSTFTKFRPGSITPSDSSSITKGFELPSKLSNNSGLYLNTSTKPTSFLNIEMGLRQNFFSRIGPASINTYNANYDSISTTIYSKNKPTKWYSTLEPRITASVNINNENSINLGYTKTYQFLHLLTNSSVGLPTDIWLPSDNNIKPQSVNHYFVGYNFRNKRKDMKLTLESYYKNMDGIIDFVDKADLFLNNNIERQIRAGKGTAYGVEFMLEKSINNFNGFLSYTWSKTFRQINGVNKDIAYPSRDDRRNSLALFMQYKFTNRFNISSTFTYNTGANYTLPLGYYTYQGARFSFFSDRNGFKVPDYHRLDLMFNLKTRRQNEWSLGIYNAYDRANIFTIFQQINEFQLNNTDLIALSVFGITPSLNYKIKLK